MRRAARPADPPSAPSPGIRIAACVARCLIVFAAFYLGSGFVRGSATIVPSAANGSNRAFADPNAHKKFAIPGEHARDAAHWGASEPLLSVMARDEARKWGARNSLSYEISPGQTKTRAIAMIGTPYQATETYTTMPVYGYCENKVENVEVLDHFIRRPGEHVVLKVRYEADTFEFSKPAEGRRCGDLVPAGRRFTDVDYVWRGAKGWVPLSELVGDRTFYDSALKPSPEQERKKAVEESEKREREQREETAERERRLQLRKARRLMGSTQ